MTQPDGQSSATTASRELLHLSFLPGCGVGAGTAPPGQHLACCGCPAFAWPLHRCWAVDAALGAGAAVHVLPSPGDAPHLCRPPSFCLPAQLANLSACPHLPTHMQAGRLDYSLPAKEALLKGDLRCHRCGAAQPNMPWLKEHIGACREAVRLPQH